MRVCACECMFSPIIVHSANGYDYILRQSHNQVPYVIERCIKNNRVMGALYFPQIDRIVIRFDDNEYKQDYDMALEKAQQYLLLV